MHEQLAEIRRTNRHRAIIIVSDASYPADGIATLNAEDFNAPVGPPTLQIANAIWPALQQAMTNRSEATVVAFCERNDSKAYNVSARIDGTDPDLAPIVIMTPRSGWWRCASERGGGIAVFMELIRALIDNPPARDVIFTAREPRSCTRCCHVDSSWGKFCGDKFASKISIFELERENLKCASSAKGQSETRYRNSDRESAIR